MISIKTQFNQSGWPFPGSFKESTDPKVTLAKEAIKAGINIVHIFDTDRPKGGMTIAFRKTTEHKSGDMVEFAIANCSPHDTFSKKIGTRIATENFLNGYTTQLPILRDKDRNDINGSVKDFFTTIWYMQL